MKKICTIAIIVLVPVLAQAQEMLGFRNSNYAGIQNLGINPALIHNSRIDIDVNLVGLGATVENDFVFLNKDKLKFFGIKNVINKFDDKEYVTEFEFNNPDKTYNASVAMNLSGLGVMFNIQNKHTFALTSQFRMGVSAQNVQGHIGKYAYEGFGYDPLHSQFFLGKDFELNILGWLEYALSYATTLKEDDKGALCGGVTLKLLNGVAAGYARNADVYYNILNDSDMVFGNGSTLSSIDYGRTSYNKFDDFGFGSLSSGKGIGFDIGFTYDFLKDPSLWKYEMDGKQLTDPTVNRYKLRLGLSLLDFGSIKFVDSSATFHLETRNGFYPNWNEDEYDNNWDFDRSYSGIFYNGDSAASYRNDNFKMKLPTALSLQADWNAYDKLYVNATYVLGFKQKETGLDRPSTLALTPRYETRWFDVSVPISYMNYTGKISRIGLGLRFASFYIGSDRLGSLLGLADLYGMDIYAGLKFSINKERIRDYDGDRVSDKMDKCREIAGLLKFEGCPDRDRDDVPDAIDRCPDIPGLVSLNGCPDKDGDGITDADDDCPDIAGIPKFKGCPDTDGDGIQDKEDDCPSVFGLAIYKGCPDTDEDGIPDPLDECPTAKGLAEYKGCPDTDGDGLPDPKDDCPFDVGPISNKGCPVKVTQAPVKVEPVVVKLTEEEQEIINKVFSNLQFETGKAVIKESSFESLDQLAELMKKKTNFKLQIDGHTDNVGSASMNKNLSIKRAESAKTYLVNKGVDASRITARGFGMDKPIAPNTTAEGRAKNRRVEFLILE